MLRRWLATTCAGAARPGVARDEMLVTRYRGLMRHVPSPVAVVTTHMPKTGERRGITVGSFTSVSLRPPIVSFCINHPSRMAALLMQTRQFAAHILSKEQVQLSIEFSTPYESPDEDPFKTVAYCTHPDTLQPVLVGTLGVLLADVVGVHEVGDHQLWLGKVHTVEECFANPTAEPLLYYHGGYHSVGEAAFIRAFEDRSLVISKWTHKAHVRMAWNYLREHGLVRGTELIRNGIKHYNEKNKEHLTLGYHETTTLFFVRMLWLALQATPEISEFKPFLDRHPFLGQYRLIHMYYSRRRLLQPRAFSEWVDPDLRPMPSSSADVPSFPPPPDTQPNH